MCVCVCVCVCVCSWLIVNNKATSDWIDMHPEMERGENVKGAGGGGGRDGGVGGGVEGGGGF